ncbi:MAG TPA: 4-hydroxy-tetrahydrodipicolinate reductase [Dehalococcoidia bacterium]|nr:4-hydroxy-tetrahydrodipicolinate reductase [Dehalococcoidia bacterium]
MTTGKIKVIVHGALGRMGREVIASMSREPDMKVVAGVDKAAKGDSLPLENGSSLPLGADLPLVLSGRMADVLVDFSIAEASMAAARTALQAGVRVVIGTTGLSQENLAEIDKLSTANGIAAFVAPNFTLGAVLLIHLSKIASRFFDYAEIIELHHEKKFDAPSGTALSTAKTMAEARGKRFQYPQVHKETLKGTRGGETGGIAIHSVRMPGLLAHQEVIFGAPGQTLAIRHDSINRECYMPGVALAIREVMKRKGLTVGLENLLGLQ